MTRCLDMVGDDLRDVNRVFIPGSEKFSIARFSNSHVNGDKSANGLKTSVSLSVMLDYRCHARNGFLGKNSYGDKLDTCLSELASMLASKKR